MGRLGTIVLAVALAVLAGVAVTWRDEPDPARTQPTVRPVTRPAVEVLRAWDADRAAAWAAGDVDRLRRLYVPGSRAGDRDVRLLQRYAARGLRVRDLRVQRLRVAVQVDRPDELVLRVVERLAGGRVVPAATGRSRRGAALPVSVARERTVTLRRTGTGGRWRVASVTEPGRTAQPP